MLSKQPILTIAIPTYNRPEKIKAQVNVLLPQLNDKVHLVIYDNCSDTKVETLFKPNEILQFHLVRNRVNVGADANIARCFENCTTKWLWTLSDDDLVKEDAVESILNEIEKNEEAVFINLCSVSNFSTRNFDEIAAKFKSPRVFVNSFQMSSCLYNMSILSKSLHNYYNNLSSMMGTIIMVLKHVQNHNLSHCRFVDLIVVKDFDNVVSWDYSVYILRTQLFIDAFSGLKSRNLHNKLSLGCYIINYSLIELDRKESKVNYSKRWNLYLYNIKNQGLLNALIYCPKPLIRTFLNLILPQSIFNFVVGK
ncbi:hypothetical protein B0A75_15985 [Flavobacterium oncorhynchi]|uniref:Glycosyltransferase 2-like domain-containing protein n=1 Tax=Flavobacterium oncorhynchi TaxID=728056 RepID=A0A226HUZ7_9FLAO|nr:glycosyltransferase family 2 protein [Flavobacterium oncorhynchi]OXA97461.1 hypothetical protein B0A75_15985 [Flavobacterium oncorhynchi]